MKDLIKRAQNELAHSAERENLRSKSKTKARLLERLMLLMLALCLTAACSDKNEDEPEKPDNPSGPTTPTGDEFTVAATGGTVEKGDIAITFPSGTFTGETKVYVKEVTKGEIRSEDEVSTFCQVTMPAIAGQPIKVKVKSDETDADIILVARMLGGSLDGQSLSLTTTTLLKLLTKTGLTRQSSLLTATTKIPMPSELFHSDSYILLMHPHRQMPAAIRRTHARPATVTLSSTLIGAARQRLL